MKPGQLEITGDVGTYRSVCLRAGAITMLTLGIAYPYAYVMKERWLSENSLINGREWEFAGDAHELFGRWIRWWPLIVVTLGIYGFWVSVEIDRWRWRHRSFADRKAQTHTAYAARRNVERNVR